MTSRERERGMQLSHFILSLWLRSLLPLARSPTHWKLLLFTLTHMQEQRRCRCYVFVFAKIKQQFNNFFVAKRACSFSLIFVFSFFFAVFYILCNIQKRGPAHCQWVDWTHCRIDRQTDWHTHTRALASTHTSALAWLDGIQWVVVPETNASNGRLKSKWQNWTASRMSAGEWGNALRTTTTAQQLARETRFKGNFKQH